MQDASHEFMHSVSGLPEIFEEFRNTGSKIVSAGGEMARAADKIGHSADAIGGAASTIDRASYRTGR